MSTKSTAVCSPATATSKKSNWTTKTGNNFNSPKLKVKPTQLATSISKGANVTSLKTTFTTPHRLQNIPNSRDIALLHESRIFKSLLAASATKTVAPKRNPIVHDNNQEPVEAFRPSVRRLASADEMSACSTEVISRSRHVGEYNYIYNPQTQDAKPAGVKTFVFLPSESTDENVRRISKEVRNKSTMAVRNPIVEGDTESIIIRRSKGAAGEQVDHQKKLNERKYLLPADRGRSPRGRLFRDATDNIVGTDYSLECQTERIRTEPSRPMSALEEKMRGSIKDVMEYTDAPKFRKENGVSGKCTEIKFNDLAGNGDNERIFARKFTLA